MSEPPQSPRTRVEPTFHNDDSDGNEVAASTGYEEEERHNDGKPMPGTEVQGSADYIGDMLPEWLSAVRKMVEAESRCITAPSRCTLEMSNRLFTRSQ